MSLVSEVSPLIWENVAGAHNSGLLYTKTDIKIGLTKHSTKTTWKQYLYLCLLKTCNMECYKLLLYVVIPPKNHKPNKLLSYMHYTNVTLKQNKFKLFPLVLQSRSTRAMVLQSNRNSFSSPSHKQNTHKSRANSLTLCYPEEWED